MAQFSVKIMRLNGSVLLEKQHQHDLAGRKTIVAKYRRIRQITESKAAHHVGFRTSFKKIPDAEKSSKVHIDNSEIERPKYRAARLAPKNKHAPEGLLHCDR